MGLNTEGRRGGGPVGRSLFHEIPKNRDCKDARIPTNFCVCQEKLEEGALKPNDRVRFQFNKCLRQIVTEYMTRSDYKILPVTGVMITNI